MSKAAILCGMQATEVTLAYDAILAVLIKEINDGDKTSIPSFARIEAIKRKPKESVDPVTGETKLTERPILIKAYVLKSVINKIREYKNVKQQ